jgi:hypothetical protein
MIVKEYLDPIHKKKMKENRLCRNIQIPIPVELLVVNHCLRTTLCVSIYGFSYDCLSCKLDYYRNIAFVWTRS